MGVQGLWQLLNPTGRPVSLQSLEGKILAVDVSIWLHQAVKGMRDKDGNPLPNAHLQVLFNRLCKLLYYRIKPVFVFDGGVPVLKRQTMAGRRQKKKMAEFESDKATKTLVQNLLKSHAIGEVLKKDDKKPASSSGLKPSTSKAGKPDLFELPPLPEEFKSIAEESRRTEFTVHERMLLEDVDLSQIDIESDAFNTLPAEMKHEVLTLLKEKKKRHTWNQILELPQESNDFSKFQMVKLMKQNKLSSQLEQVKKEMNDNRSGELTSFLGDDFYSDAIETRKIMSDDRAHSILIKGLGSKEQKEEMERIRLELEQKKKKEKLQDENEEVNDTKTEDEHQKFIAYKIKQLEFVEVDENEMLNNDKTDVIIMEESEKNLMKSYEADSSKCVQSERQDILLELQQRMNVLKDENVSEDVKLVCDNDLNKKTNVEINKSPVNVDSNDIVNISTNDSGDLIQTRSDDVIITCVASNSELSNVDSSKIDHTGKPFVDMSLYQEKSESCESNDLISKCSGEDLVTKRQSILDELRQKVNVLSANTELEDNMEIVKDNENIEEDNENKTSEIQLVITESRKALMKKQLSVDEEQASKKRKIEKVIGEDKDDTQKPISVVESSSDSEDEGFIEVTVDTDKAQADDLFPADIFHSVNSDEKNYMFNIENQASILSEEQEKEDPTNDDQEVMSHDNPDLHEMMSQESSEHSESEEVVTQNIADKFDEDAQYTDLVDQFRNFTENDMREYQDMLEVESRDLQQERGRQERLAVSITDQMYIEAQELLELFGVPYIISPMEAEAQCAQLDAADLTQGTITDDSDVWLFGGRRVYKNFFYQDKHVEFFSEISIKSQLGLDRDVFIKLALLCGSDYTEGIQGVGVITAMELLTEFPGENLDGLKAFKKWWNAAQTQITAPLEAKIRTKLRNLQVPEEVVTISNPVFNLIKMMEWGQAGFPNEVVVRAYMNPEVDDSQEKFAWGQPELDLIRLFTKTKCGWSKEKCDENLVPMMKQHNLKQTQTRINAFFQPENFLQPKNIKSKRLQRVLNIMQRKEDTVTGTVEKSGDPINQYVNIPVRPALQSTSMIRQSTVGKGRGRGKGKGKGKGKSSVGQRSKVVITNEVNLSESSSESSGDELIANLDYESILGLGAPSENPETCSNEGNNAVPQIETKDSQPQPTSKSKSTTRKTNSATEAISHAIVTDTTQNSNGHSTSANVTSAESQTSTGRVKGHRTKPNVRVGKSGHATEDFSADLPREHINMKGFLEDEAKTFDKVKKVKSKTMTVQSSELKEQKSDKGKKLSKNPQTKAEKVSEKLIMDTSERESKEPGVKCDSLLYRRTRSCKTGLVNRVLVVSDSDSD